MKESKEKLCVLCQHKFGDEECESLICGHVFHAECLADYISTTGKPKTHCCPIKCYESNISFGTPPLETQDVVVVDGDEGASSSAARASDLNAANTVFDAATQLFAS